MAIRGNVVVVVFYVDTVCPAIPVHNAVSGYRYKHYVAASSKYNTDKNIGS